MIIDLRGFQLGGEKKNHDNKEHGHGHGHGAHGHHQTTHYKQEVALPAFVGGLATTGLGWALRVPHAFGKNAILLFLSGSFITASYLGFSIVERDNNNPLKRIKRF